MRVKLWRNSFSLINLMRVITLQGWLMRLPTRLIDAIMHMCWRLASSGNSMSESRTHQEAEAARVRAVAKKEHREAVEQARKRPHIEEVEDEPGTFIKHCKWCIAKGMPSLWLSSSY